MPDYSVIMDLPLLKQQTPLVSSVPRYYLEKNKMTLVRVATRGIGIQNWLKLLQGHIELSGICGQRSAFLSLTE